MIKRLLIGVAMLTMVTGCTIFQNVDQAKLVTQVAVLKVIEAQGPAHYQERAANVARIATEAKTWLDTNGVTLAFLRAAVEARVAKMNLALSDQVLVGVLLDATIAELQKKVGDGAIDPQKLYYVNQVLDWTIQAAHMYGV